MVDILRTENLVKNFGNLTAVDDVNIKIEKEEIRGLIGPNGSGKTTLFNLLTGFHKPSNGKIVWQGELINGLSSHRIARKGIVRTFQLTNLFNDMSVLDNMIIAHHLQMTNGLLTQFLIKNSDREKIIEENSIKILDELGLARVKSEVAGTLPYGQQRSLGLAIALAAKPRLLLLDEPAAGLNPSETNEMMSKLKELRNNGVTILLVEHDLNAVMKTCDRLTVMNFGQVIAEGVPEEISTNRQVLEAYIGLEDDYT